MLERERAASLCWRALVRGENPASGPVINAAGGDSEKQAHEKASHQRSVRLKGTPPPQPPGASWQRKAALCAPVACDGALCVGSGWSASTSERAEPTWSHRWRRTNSIRGIAAQKGAKLANAATSQVVGWIPGLSFHVLPVRARVLSRLCSSLRQSKNMPGPSQIPVPGCWTESFLLSALLQER